MCDAHVIATVKQRLLSRRSFLSTAPALAAASTLAAAPLAQARGGPQKVVDLTHTLTENFPTFGRDRAVSLKQRSTFDRDGQSSFYVTLNEHAGTHIDAPFHFSPDGMTVDQIPVGQLVCPLVVIDVSSRAGRNPDTAVTPDDLKAWRARNGDFPPGCCVAMYSGWERRANSNRRFRNADEDGVMHFPGFHGEAAKMLLEESSAVGLATDTLSIDIGASTRFEVHYTWLGAGRWGLEGVANLGELPSKGAIMIVGAPVWEGGSGGPSRVMALV